MEANLYLGFWGARDLGVIGMNLSSFGMGRSGRVVLVLDVK